MEKLPICRICLARNVRMHIVVNRNLHELYERLTDIPFVTEDIGPILVCFFCCAKLKQCYRFQRKCLKAEELFAQMMNEDYGPNSLITQNHLEVFSGFIKSPIVHISIIDECQKRSIAIKEELSAVCNDVIEPKEEHQSDELEPENVDNIYLDVEDIPSHHSESDLEDDVPLMELETKVEEEQVISKKKRSAGETKRATVARKPKLDTQITKQEDAVTVEQTKKKTSHSKLIRTSQKRTSNPGTYLKEPYKCDQSSIGRVEKNIQHTRTQIGEKPYKCDVCQRSYSQKCRLLQHVRIHTGEKPFKCDRCQRSFCEKGNLTKHIRIHTGEKPYNCDVCQRGYSRKSSLSQHVRIHTGAKPFKCDICQRSFCAKTNLTKHILIHSGEKPYNCDLCQRSFCYKSNLKTHIRLHNEKPYKCDVCQRSYSQKANLLQHIGRHMGEKPFKCDICQRSFSDKGNLTTHIRQHDEKPYKRDVCQRSYSQKANLSQHISKNIGEEPFKCNLCQRCFSSKNNLTRHIRIHTGEKPFKCNVCMRSFRQNCHLLRHILIHAGEKPFKSDIKHIDQILKL